MRVFFIALSCSILGFGSNLEDYIETIPNFPHEGIQFKWYPKLLKSPSAFHEVIKRFKTRYEDRDLDAIIGLDSRGFVFGAALAYEMNLPFIMIRKKGKLPKPTLFYEYELEYGTSCFEIEKDSLNPLDKVLIIDDILATGGSMQAAANLVTSLGAEIVECACLIELCALKGQQNLKLPVFSLIRIDP